MELFTQPDFDCDDIFGGSNGKAKSPIQEHLNGTSKKESSARRVGTESKSPPPPNQTRKQQATGPPPAQRQRTLSMADRPKVSVTQHLE